MLRGRRRAGVSDIARRLGIAKSTAHRLLTTLCSRGMTEKNPESGLYRLGMHLFELGQLAQARLRLRQLACPCSASCGPSPGTPSTSASPTVPDVVHAERLDSPDSVRVMGRWVGVSRPTAPPLVKVIAAFNPDFAEARRRAGFPPAPG